MNAALLATPELRRAEVEAQGRHYDSDDEEFYGACAALQLSRAC